MRRYLIEASYAPDTWRAMVDNPDAFDGSWLREVVQRLDGEVDSLWWTASGGDAVVICQLPNDICLAALIAAFRGNGMVDATNVRILLSIEEQIAALKQARGD